MGLFSKLFGLNDPNPHAINQYFHGALWSYGFLRNENSKYAAITSGKVADTGQRYGLVMYSSAAAEIISESGRVEIDPTNISSRFLEIVNILNEKDWDLDDISVAKSDLGARDKNMLAALNNFDGTYFRNLHPTLFSGIIGPSTEGDDPYPAPYQTYSQIMPSLAEM